MLRLRCNVYRQCMVLFSNLAGPFQRAGCEHIHDYCVSEATTFHKSSYCQSDSYKYAQDKEWFVLCHQFGAIDMFVWKMGSFHQWATMTSGPHAPLQNDEISVDVMY